MRRRAVIAASIGVLLAGTAAGCSESSEANSSTEPTAGPNVTTPSTAATRYSLVRTRRCLEQSGVVVGRLGKENPRLQALGDLAQRTSLAVRDGGEIVGLAFGNAGLLAELLAAPNDRYTIKTQGNALLLYRPSAGRLAGAVLDCLRS